MYTITVIDLYSGEGNPRPKDVQFHKETITIGRSGENDLVLRQTNVSTKHATISLTGQGFFLEDLGSTNGTFVNKNQLTGAMRVYGDDRIEMGGTVLTLSGHPSLERSTAGGTTGAPTNDPFPYDISPSPSSPASSPLPHQGGMGNISLDSIMPESAGAKSSSDPFFGSADTGSPFPADVQDDTFPLPPEDPGANKDGLVDKIKSLESKLMHKRAVAKASSMPPGGPIPADRGGFTSPDSQPNIKDKIKQLEQKVAGRRSSGIPGGPAVPGRSGAADPFPAQGRQSASLPFPEEGPEAAESYDHKIVVTVACLDNTRFVKEFQGNSVIIGRSPECGISLPHSMVSGRHAILEYQNGRVTVRDLASKNGTYIEKNQVRDATPVTSKDTIIIGNFFLKVELIESSRRETPEPEMPSSTLPSTPVSSPGTRSPLRTITQAPPDATREKPRAPSSGNFLETAVQFHLARKSITAALKKIQNLAIAKSEIRPVSADLARAARTLYLARSHSAQKEQLASAADQALPLLHKSLVLMSTNTIFGPASDEVIRAISLVYLFSSSNLSHQDGLALPAAPIAPVPGHPLGAAIAQTDGIAETGEKATDGTLIARIVLKSELENLASIRAFARSFAESLFFDSYQSLQLENVVDEACTNVIEHAFDRPAQGSFCVSFYSLSDTKLAITVDDKGIPFDTSKAESGELDGLGMKLMRAFASEVHVENRGRKGKRIRLVLALPTRLSGIFTSIRLTGYDREIIDAATEYKIRFVESKDAIEIPRCVFRAHGYTYWDESIYLTDHVRALLDDGKQMSVIAFTAQNTTVGYLSISRAAADSNIGNLEHLIVAPQLRRSSLPSKLISHLVEKARAHQMIGVTSKLATSHPYEQIALGSLGAHATGVLLGHFPDTESDQPDETHKNTRQASLFVFLKLNQEQPLTVYLPEVYAEILHPVYESLGLTRTFEQLNQTDPAVLPSLSNLRLETSDSLGIATIKVIELGDDFLDAVKTIVNDLMQQNRYYSIYLDLPLGQAGSAMFAAALRDLHFIYACLIPESDGGDLLRLQRAGGFAPDFASIHIDDSLGKRILASIQREYEALMTI